MNSPGLQTYTSALLRFKEENQCRRASPYRKYLCRDWGKSETCDVLGLVLGQETTPVLLGAAVGDEHSAQGDSELTGDALETSMDVEFTVHLISGQNIFGPLAENDDSIMAMGIAGSLPDALRQATTSLARWLERDYKLTPNETAIVLGTSMRYDIAEIVDPQVNIVATSASRCSLPYRSSSSSGRRETMVLCRLS